MASRTGMNDSKAYDIASLLQDDSIQTTSTPFSDVFFQFITAASTVRNSTLASFAGATQLQATLKNFFFVNYNGLNAIRVGSDEQAQAFYDFYYSDLDYFNVRFAIMMAVGIATVIIFQILLVPIVFSVLKTNNRVLALFGSIPRDDIYELADRCERYRGIWLERQIQQDDHSYEDSDRRGEEEEGEDNPDGEEENEVASSVSNEMSRSNLEESGLQNVNASVNTEGEGVANRMNMYRAVEGLALSVNPTHLIVPKSNTNISSTSQKVPRENKNSGPKQRNSIEEGNRMKNSMNASGMMRNSSHSSVREKTDTEPVKTREHLLTTEATKRPMVNKMNSGEEEEKRDELYERSQKLLNSKNNNRWRVAFHFLCICLLLASYFVLDYCLEVAFISDTQLIYSMLRLVAMRTSVLKFTNLIVQENIANVTRLTDANGILHS